MKLRTRFLCIFSLLSLVSTAQPEWSPAVRAERDTAWLKDSLHLDPAKLQKSYTLSVAYHTSKDKAKQTGGKNKDKNVRKLEQARDADFKKLLTKEQFARFYRREQMARKREKIKYDNQHRPY